MQWFNLNLQSFSLSFLSILFERSAFHVHRNIDLGFVDAFVHPQMMKRILPRNTGLAIGLSALLRFDRRRPLNPNRILPSDKRRDCFSQQHGRRADMDIGAIWRPGEINDPACRIMSAFADAITLRMDNRFTDWHRRLRP
jgi:hypothetical protein